MYIKHTQNHEPGGKKHCKIAFYWTDIKHFRKIQRVLVIFTDLSLLQFFARCAKEIRAHKLGVM